MRLEGALLLMVSFYLIIQNRPNLILIALLLFPFFPAIQHIPLSALHLTLLRKRLKLFRHALFPNNLRIEMREIGSQLGRETISTVQGDLLISCNFILFSAVGRERYV